jgi:chaperonin cofactor prefoldin
MFGMVIRIHPTRTTEEPIMHHRSLLPALLLMASAMLAAADGMPDGLPHERVVLRDGRQLSGHYDEAQGILWLDGAGSPRLRVTPDDIVKRTPIVADNDKKAPRAPAEKTVPLPTAAPSPESLQLAVAALERQLTDLDRKMLESRAELNKVNAHFQEWLKVYAKAEKIAQADPGTGIGYENNASYNLTKIRSEIRAVREQLTRAQDTLARQTERRQELLANLRETQQNLASAKSKSSTPSVTVYTLEAAPPTNTLLEQRLETLEAELRSMQQDNERLRKLLEALTPPKPQPTTPTQPSQVDPVNELVAVIP